MSPRQLKIFQSCIGIFLFNSWLTDSIIGQQTALLFGRYTTDDCCFAAMMADTGISSDFAINYYPADLFNFKIFYDQKLLSGSSSNIGTVASLERYAPF